MCIKGLRLATMQLPEKFSLIGVGTNRSSHIRVSANFPLMSSRKFSAELFLYQILRSPHASNKIHRQFIGVCDIGGSYISVKAISGEEIVYLRSTT